jgi:diaminohydroxyphosphoribosylaminopyrimidine deaminase / 5-amino-6-(5-phosphoribosylamino)uracil reductase
MSLANDKISMKRSLDLARIGVGKVSPNPMVGCVVVRNGKIIGEGAHQEFGGPHAEVFALLHAGKKAMGAALYVNLEPCAHFGKTPPCADAIIQAGISKVVIGARDPNPLVSGKGIKRLRESGIEVRVGVLKNESENLNEKFFKFMRTDIPFVGIKLAQTLDGRIADKNHESKWITSELARKEVHRIRSEYDAVMVGAGSVLKDNPELTVRLVKGRNPVRVVIDGRMSLPVSMKVFNTVKAPTWILTSSKAMNLKKEKVRKLASLGTRVISISSSFILSPMSILSFLGSEGVSSVLIEGGADTISSFVEANVVDKLFLFTAPKIFGGGLCGFNLKPPLLVSHPIRLMVKKVAQIGEDFFVEANFHHK